MNTEPPVQNFDTGFEGQSDAELCKFFQARLDRHTNTQTTSISDSWSSWGSNSIPGPVEVSDEHHEIWWKWRVPFQSAWTFWNAIGSIETDAMEIYSRPEYRSADGILQTEIPEKIIDGGD
ncbi:hypothetical protein BBP40_001189 [Aspergillus hancockii]|nr:hypothetical protein BBP40_001189 [Aspergillus hancockii]